jgi:oligopeptide transport system substrate-binding protein
MRRMLFLIAAVLLAGAAVPWLVWPPARATGPVVAISLPRTIDPVLASRLDEYRLITALFEPLVRLDPANLKPQPGLAASWEVDADGLAWTFHLDQRSRWSDGKPVVAEDMRRGLMRHLTAHSPNAFLLESTVAGATEVARGAPPESAGFACPDARTLVIRLKRPVAYFVSLMSLSVFVPATAAQAAAGDLRDQAAQWTDPIAVVGNGPLVCRGHLPRHHYDFAPNPRYGGAHPASGELRALIVENPGTALRMYLSGQVDAVLGLPADAVGDLRRAKEPGLQLAPSLDTEFFRVRQVPRPDAAENPTVTAALRHPRLRLALARSVDRQVLAEELLQGNALPATTFVPARLADYLPYHAPVEVLAYDLDRARADLAAARADLGAIPDLDLLVPSQPAERVRAAELVVDGWRRSLGLRVTLTILLQTELRSRERSGAYDLSRASWLGDFLDPTTFLDCFRAGGGANRTGFADPEYDRLLDQAAGADAEERWRLLESAERRLLEQVPLIPLYHNACSFLVRPGLAGIRANPLEVVHFDEVGWR